MIKLVSEDICKFDYIRLIELHYIQNQYGWAIQCVQKKRTTYFQTAVTSFRIVEIKNVGRDLERAKADLSNAYH